PRRWWHRRRARRRSRLGRRRARPRQLCAPPAARRCRQPRRLSPPTLASPAARSFCSHACGRSRGRVISRPFRRSVAQSGSAPRPDRGGAGLKPCHSDQHLAKNQILFATGAATGWLDKVGTRLFPMSRGFSRRWGARAAPPRSAEPWHTSTNQELPILTEEFSFGRAVRPAYTIKTPSLAKRFQPQKATHGIPTAGIIA